MEGGFNRLSFISCLFFILVEIHPFFTFSYFSSHPSVELALLAFIGEFCWAKKGRLVDGYLTRMRDA
jgi:hypothetical protein